MNGIINAKDITFEYASDENTRIRALKDIGLDINEGEFAVILGHNGSGKSTFAKLINALLLPTRGQMTINGMDTASDDDLFKIRSTAGMVFQNPDNQLVATVVDEDVAFGPENLGIPREEIITRVNDALKAVRMEKFAKMQPHMLSGGQKQRIAIAGVLAIHPQIIVFDESTAMLDPQGREEVLSIMRKLNKEGMTIVFITHFMEEAVFADKIFVFNDGRIIGSGTPREIMYDTALLESAGLSTTFAAQMCIDLRKNGIEIKRDVLTIEELAEEICASKSKI